jgi:hypothetical protein
MVDGEDLCHVSAKRPARGQVTLRLDADVVTWARVRAAFAGTSINALIRQFLADYAAVPPRFSNGEGPPWTDARNAAEAFRQVIDPMGAGTRAREEEEVELPRQN